MSTDEKHKCLGKTVENLKGKIDERNLLRGEIQTLIDAFQKLFTRYNEGKYDEVAALLKQLPQNDPTIQLFQKFLEAEEALARHQRTLGLTIKEAQ